MFILDSTSKSLKANLSAAAATVNPDFVTAWADSNGTTFVGGGTDGAFNGTTDVTLAAAPSSGNQRYIKFARVHNRDSAAVTVNIKYDNGSTQRIVQRITLGAGETWTPDGSYDTGGSLKTSTIGSAAQINILNGIIIPGYASTLTIYGVNFGTSAVIVRFTSGATIVDSSTTPTGNGSTISIVVPATIYNLAAGTSVTINVITGAGQVSNSYVTTVASLPTGGNITVASSYRIHTFNATGNFVTSSFVPSGGYEYLIVGGGGGGGAGNGGAGGGAGGYRTGTSSNVVINTTYLVTIGAGGAAAANGSDSSVFSIFSAGGGGGQSQGIGSKGNDGGSGGGAGGGGGGGSLTGAGAIGLGNTPATTPSQGNNGGQGWLQNTADGGGGGGGAGAVGSNGGANAGGIGGIGANTAISGSNVFYSGGGGGSSYSGSFANGGNGGGGRGGNGSNAGAAGTANTGGGGGAGSSGGTGGSGVVIIRYLLPT